MRKSKKETAASEESFNDFNHDDFADLDINDDTEEGDIDTLSTEDSDLATEFHGADPDLPEMGEVQKTKRGLVDILKDNWLYVAIGLGVIIVAGYLIMSLFSTPTPQTQPQVANSFTNVPTATTQTGSTPATTDSTPNSTPDTGTTNTASTAATTTEIPGVPTSGNVTMSDAQMQTLLDAVAKVVQQNAQNIQNAIASGTQAGSNEKLAALESSVANLNNSVNALNQTLANVDARLTATQNQLGAVLAQQTASEQKLTLRAVVPGRAWLVDAGGHTVSVTEGSPLGAFGTVTAIDTTNNTVSTSSGYVFK